MTLDELIAALEALKKVDYSHDEEYKIDGDTPVILSSDPEGNIFHADIHIENGGFDFEDGERDDEWAGAEPAVFIYPK